jgi:hypothetical protein
MTDPGRSPLDSVLDVVVYAPIGAFFHGPRVVSELAERGRSDVGNAKAIGSLAIAKARAEAGDLTVNATERMGEMLVAVARAAGAPLAGAGEPTAPHADPSSTDHVDAPDAGAESDVSTRPAPSLRIVGDAPDAGELPIPDYDNLSASQVVPRLDDLGEAELDQVRAYEQAHRGRMTILSRIAQLQAS